MILVRSQRQRRFPRCVSAIKPNRSSGRENSTGKPRQRIRRAGNGDREFDERETETENAASVMCRQTIEKDRDRGSRPAKGNATTRPKKIAFCNSLHICCKRPSTRPWGELQNREPDLRKLRYFGHRNMGIVARIGNFGYFLRKNKYCFLSSGPKVPDFGEKSAEHHRETSHGRSRGRRLRPFAVFFVNSIHRDKAVQMLFTRTTPRHSFYRPITPFIPTTRARYARKPLHQFSADFFVTRVTTRPTLCSHNLTARSRPLSDCLGWLRRPCFGHVSYVTGNGVRILFSQRDVKNSWAVPPALEN